MDDKENDTRYPRNSSYQQDYDSRYPRESNQFTGGTEEDLDDEMGEEEVETNGVIMIGKDTFDDEEEEDDEVTDDDEEEEDDGDQGDGEQFNEKEDIGNGRPQKKRKLRTLISNYEFAPRVPNPHVQKAKVTQPLSCGTLCVGDWTERETSALLDAWGERFLRLGRKNLRAEEWQEVAEKVSHQTKIERTDAQCRNRLATLKKKYKKENMRLAARRSGSSSSKWVFYRKMDTLLSSPSQQHTGLSCGIDSGEYVFMNPNTYLNRANGLDEMRDSPENSESRRNEKDDSDGLPPTKGKRNRGRRVDNSFQLLANSMQKFSDMYVKIETKKREQMVELENMRMEFHKQIETERRQILERAQAEIVKIRQGDDYENDLSAENLSG